MANEQEPRRQFDWRSITPEDSPLTPMDVMSDPAARDLATPKLSEGDPAFDIELPVFDFSDGSERVALPSVSFTSARPIRRKVGW